MHLTLFLLMDDYLPIWQRELRKLKGWMEDIYEFVNK